MTALAETPALGHSGAPFRPVNLAAGMVLVAAAFAALVMPGADTTALQVRNYSIAAMCLGVGGALLVSQRGGLLAALGAGRIGPWASLSFALIFGLGSMQWTQPQSVGFARMLAPESVVSALALINFAWASWIVGYLANLLGFARNTVSRVVDLAIPPETINRDWRPIGVWLLFSIGLVGQAIRSVTNTFGYLTNANAAITTFSGIGHLVVFLSDMGLFAVVLAAINYFSPARRGGLTPLVVISTSQAMLGLLQGSKEGVAIVVIAIALSYGLVKGRISVPLLVVSAIIFTFVVLPFVTNYREYVRGPNGQVLSATAAVGVIPVAAAETLTVGGYADSYERMASRLRNIDSLAIVIQKSPDLVPYQPLSDLVVQPAVGLVPRALWPGKPAFIGSYEFGQVYYSAPPGFVSAWAVTPEGDLYRRGGPLVLLIGMGLLGALYRLFDETLTARRDNRHLLLVVVLFAPMVKHETEIAPLLLSLPVGLLGVALALRALGLVGARADSSLPRASVRKKE